MQNKKVLGHFALVAALALSYESYARSNASGIPGRGFGAPQARAEPREERGTFGTGGVTSGKPAQDDPEYLRNDSSTVGSTTSTTTYDPSKGGIAGENTSTSTDTNRSSADQRDEEL